MPASRRQLSDDKVWLDIAFLRGARMLEAGAQRLSLIHI